MLWTDEAVETLRRLACDGLSASVIAAALGAESRNAVIGKANRIGVQLGGGRGGPSGAPRAVRPGSGKPAPAPPHEEPLRRPARPFAGAEVGEMRRVTFQEIGRAACRWPVGDPTSDDFSYCGLESANGRPYCAGHCRLAYRPPNARARPSPDERWPNRLANSWRQT